MTARVIRSDAEQLSFWNLAEAFVLKALREEHRMSLQRIRTAIGELSRQYPQISHPLAQLELAVLNRDLYADREGLLVDASRGGQLGIRRVLELYLARIERDAPAPRASFRSHGRRSRERRVQSP